MDWTAGHLSGLALEEKKNKVLFFTLTYTCSTLKCGIEISPVHGCFAFFRMSSTWLWKYLGGQMLKWR